MFSVGIEVKHGLNGKWIKLQDKPQKVGKNFISKQQKLQYQHRLRIWEPSQASIEEVHAQNGIQQNLLAVTPKNNDLEQDKSFGWKKDTDADSKHNYSNVGAKMHHSSNKSELNCTSEMIYQLLR